jgi:hypothetical protein
VFRVRVRVLEHGMVLVLVLCLGPGWVLRLVVVGGFVVGGMLVGTLLDWLSVRWVDKGWALLVFLEFALRIPLTKFRGRWSRWMDGY